MSEHNVYRNWDLGMQRELERCTQMLANGEIGAVLSHLNRLEFASAADKKVVFIQMLHSAGLPDQAYKEIGSLDLPLDPLPEALLRLAHVCCDAGADREAEAYLERVSDDELAEHSLLLASRIAERLGSSRLQAHFESRVIAEFPSFTETNKLLLRRAVEERRFADAALLLHPSVSDSREPLFRLQQIADEEPVNTGAIVELATRHPRTLLPLTAVRYLLARGEIERALDVAILLVGTEKEEEVRAILSVLDALLLRRDSKNFMQLESKVRGVVKGIVGYLATRPERGYVRQRLIELLSVERSGDIGKPLILAVCVNLVDEGGLFLGPHMLPADGSANIVLESTFRSIGTRWLVEREPCIPGRTRLPRDLITIDPDVCVASVCSVMSSGTTTVASDADVKSLKNWLLLGAAVVPYTKDPDLTAVLFRIATTKLAIAGYQQQSRDLCEELLSQCSNSRPKAQSAWFAMADVYSRLHDGRTSLVAFACAIAGPNKGQVPRTSFNEMNLWVRLLRESGLLDHALDALAMTNTALKASGTFAEHAHQQMHMELTIELERIVRDVEARAEELPGLAMRVSKAARQALYSGEEGVQAVALLAQLINLCRTFKIEVPEAATETLAWLAGSGFSSKRLVDALMGGNDTLVNLWELYRSEEPAKFATDAAYDAKQLTVAARMMLTLDLGNVEAKELLLPFELLADSGVAAPGWRVNARPPERFSSIAGIIEVAEHLREHGIALVLAAFDNRGKLTSLSYENGDFKVVRECRFSYEEFRKWSVAYPLDYSKDVDGGEWRKEDKMRLSLSGCTWKSLPQCATLFICEAELRSIPVNLLWTGDDFIGASQPVGAAPSLAWLSESFKRLPRANPRLTAWISNAGDQSQTLNVLIGFLRGAFKDHGVVLDTSDSPPRDLAESDLVFVAAHGQVSPDGRYFHSLNDEGSLKVPADVVAKAVRNSRVAVLFVCSGGRSDKVPDANTTSGLAKQLLSMGCSTVIASPWPIEAMVAASWAPKFLKHWKSGVTVLQASHDANREIAGDSSRRLAMNLYGDPCQKFRL